MTDHCLDKTKPCDESRAKVQGVDGQLASHDRPRKAANCEVFDNKTVRRVLRRRSVSILPQSVFGNPAKGRKIGAILKLLGTGFILGTLCASLSNAHPAREVTYLGTQCHLPGDFERAEVKALCGDMTPGTEWEDLVGLSRFGHIGNRHSCGRPPAEVDTTTVPDLDRRNPGDMVVTCPIPRNAMRQGTGIDVSLKVETTLAWRDGDGPEEKINKNLRCELLNIHRNGGRAAHRTHTGPHVVNSELLARGESRVATIGLNLSQSNASQDFDALGGGAYVINCTLPGRRGGIVSRIIQYTVRENN